MQNLSLRFIEQRAEEIADNHPAALFSRLEEELDLQIEKRFTDIFEMLEASPFN